MNDGLQAAHARIAHLEAELAAQRVRLAQVTSELEEFKQGVEHAQ